MVTANTHIEILLAKGVLNQVLEILKNILQNNSHLVDDNKNIEIRVNFI
jgi:hypothetical protein